MKKNIIGIVIFFVLKCGALYSQSKVTDKQSKHKEYLTGLTKLEESETAGLQIMENTLIYDVEGNKLDVFKVFPLLNKEYRVLGAYKNKEGRFVLMEVELIDTEKAKIEKKGTDNEKE